MKAMVLRRIGTLLRPEETLPPEPCSGQIRVKVEACAVCRTDLHVVDGDLSQPKLPLIPGHEIVGIVDRIGTGVGGFAMGERVGIPWLGHTCGKCPYCATGHENLCDEPLFTGYTRDGGFAELAVADAAFVFKLVDYEDPAAAAPLMCAGLIGWRSLVAAGDGKTIGIYGFGAAAHIIAQVCRWQRRAVYAFTRPTRRRRPSPAASAPCGPAAPTRIRPCVSTRRSSSHRSARSCRPRSGMCERADGSSAAGST